MVILKILISTALSIGMYLILADLFKLPYYKTSKAIMSLSKWQKEKSSDFEMWLKSIALFISNHLRLNDFKKAQLESDLQIARIDLTPEMFKANAIVKSMIICVLAIPMYFIFPMLSPVVLVLAIALYNNEIRSVTKRIKEKQKKIEYELPRFVFNIEKTLKHSRDVVYMLESFKDRAEPELKHELEITIADMKSGNYESAITRLESRVGSSMMSDICRGLIGIIRGDETQMYWASLGIKFSDYQRQQLRLEAQKVPRKVKRLSMCLLLCFMLVYVVVIFSQIMSSIGVLFG